MRKSRFSDQYIRELQAKPKRYDLREGNGDGFSIRVAPSGLKTWLFIYDFKGRRRRMSLGTYPSLSLDDARKRHRDALMLLRTGTDPAKTGHRKISTTHLTGPTMEELVTLYIEQWARPRKKTWREDARILAKEVIPLWGGRQASDIKRAEVVTLLDSIASRGAAIQSNRTLAVIRKMFNFAVTHGVLEYSPCTNITPAAKENKRDRCLTENEIQTFWGELNKARISDAIRRALKLILVTAQRPGEVIAAHWSEIDGHWWTIPAGKANNGQAHRVYLTPLALELLGPKGDGLVFPSPLVNKPIHVNALASVVRKSFRHGSKEDNPPFPIDSFTPNDLRRTAANHIAEVGISHLVIARILNKAETEGKTSSLNDLHSYDREKQRAMEIWEQKLKLLTAGEKLSSVIAMLRRAQGK